MELIGKEGFTFTEGGVCAAKGFLANGLNCGLNSDQNKNDLCLIMSESECSAAAVYTQNKVKGAPILVTKQHLAKTGGKAKAVIAQLKRMPIPVMRMEKKKQRKCVSWQQGSWA